MSDRAENPAKLGVGQHARVLLLTVICSLLIFTWVVLMNRYVTRPESTETATAIDFTVPEIKPKSTPPPKPQEQKRAVRRTDASIAPLPSLGGSMSSISLSLPEFNAAAGENVSDSLLGDLEDVIMTEDAVDTPPIARNVAVPYPERAKQRQLEGQVIVSVHIDEQGKVLNVQILESDPPGVFDAAVMEASKNWSFTPAKYKGQGVDTWVNIPLPFRLN